MQITTLVPNFRWSNSGTSEYWVLISTTSDFSTLFLQAHWRELSATEIAVNLNRNLSPLTTYYWRVASMCDGVIGAYSDTATFSTADIAGPFIEPPPMLTPADGEVSASLTMTFTWGYAAGATGYQLRIYSTLSAAQDDSYYYSIRYVGGAFLRHAYTFPKAGTYYWRVLARDDIAWGPLSPIRSVTAGEAPPPAYSISGRVTVADGHGLPGVLVWANFPYNATTDAEGRYTISGLPTGSYDVRPEHDEYGFVPVSRTWRFPALTMPIFPPASTS